MRSKVFDPVICLHLLVVVRKLQDSKLEQLHTKFRNARSDFFVRCGFRARSEKKNSDGGSFIRVPQEKKNGLRTVNLLGYADCPQTTV